MYGYIFIWLVLFGLLINQTRLFKIEYNNGVKMKGWYFSTATILFFPIFWLACMGPAINDIPEYIHLYKLVPSTIPELQTYISTLDSGQGFAVLEWLIKSFFGDSVTAFRVVIAALHSIPIIWIFKKYSEDYWITIYLFVASACHIGWMMNGLRQFIAVVMILSALPLMIRQKYGKVILIVLLATTIHITAIFMLPVVFIVQGKAGNKKTLLFIALAIVAMFIFSKNPAFADMFLEGTEFAGTITQMQKFGDDGVNPIRVLVNLVPIFLAFVQKKHIAKEENKLIHICVNMSIITLGLNLMAMVTSGILMGRMAIYTSLYSFIIMPYLIRNAFTKNSQKLVNMLMIVFYFIYYCFEMGVL